MTRFIFLLMLCMISSIEAAVVNLDARITLFHEAMRTNDAVTVQRLLEETDPQKQIPMEDIEVGFHTAVLLGSADIVQHFILYASDEIRSKIEQPEILLTATANDRDAVVNLLLHNYSFDAKVLLWSILMWAARNNAVYVLEWIYEGKPITTENLPHFIVQLKERIPADRDVPSQRMTTAAIAAAYNDGNREAIHYMYYTVARLHNYTYDNDTFADVLKYMQTQD